MSVSLEPEQSCLFNHFGAGTFLATDGKYNHPEEISIGSSVFIDHKYWINIIAKGIGHTPKIIIGELCRCEEGLIISVINKIELERNVRIGKYVCISDTDHAYKDIGKPILTQGLTGVEGQVWIGEGAVIEQGVVIAGNIRIGRGSIIRTNSLVEHDIPAHCIAEGVPARIVSS
ncbi:hypothetical protein EJP82_13380 [Paenibacillus anaericanus]|uniref:Acyltransferase n=1 Tax=Paenibacillus anaericanus TaxID=170367 RepID=A0A3S1DJG7_9BACL|nr:hypothetical protein [Paenibacillus anaericanus]RUT46113.1 hypothetical protein EJP82_13380 [Paenibacillus anaericanus]